MSGLSLYHGHLHNLPEFSGTGVSESHSVHNF